MEKTVSATSVLSGNFNDALGIRRVCEAKCCSVLKYAAVPSGMSDFRNKHEVRSF